MQPLHDPEIKKHQFHLNFINTTKSPKIDVTRSVLLRQVVLVYTMYDSRDNLNLLVDGMINTFWSKHFSKDFIYRQALNGSKCTSFTFNSFAYLDVRLLRGFLIFP